MISRRKFIRNATGIFVPAIVGLSKAASMVPFNPQIRTVVGGGGPPSDYSAADLLWLDGADATKLYTDTGLTSLVASDGDAVKGWKDKSAAVNNFTQASGGVYKTGANGKNGNSIVRFNGTSQYLQKTMSLISGAYTVFAVARSTGTTNGNYGTVFTQDGNRGLYLHTEDGTGAFTALWYDGTERKSSNQSVGSWVIVCYSQNGSGQRDAYLNGSNFYTNATTNLGFTPNSTGGHGGEYLGGDVAEIRVYNSQLSSTDRGTVTTYLNYKWAVY